MIVNDRDSSESYFGYSYQAHYILNYLDTIGAKTFLVEENYIDKDYLIDYSKFYARSFKPYERFTRRMHFFSSEFDANEFLHILNDKQSEIDALIHSYLGFVVIKPILNAADNPLIGRTALKPYPPEVDGDSRVFLTCSNSVSLYGIDLCVDSLRFQSQDIAVGACATTALWVTLQPLKDLFGTNLHSLAEITERSILFPSEFRNFPSVGLNLNQIITYIKSNGLDTECINLESGNDSEIRKDLVSDVVKAFMKSGYPLIATLRIERDDEPPDYHAIVISGYRCNQKGIVNELYIHDDQIGPYSRVTSNDGFLQWNNEWIQKFGYDKISIHKLLIPLYPKIRLSFFKMYAIFSQAREQNLSNGFLIDLFISQLNNYKKFLLGQDIKNKDKILITPLPKFLWIIRYSFNECFIKDIVYDGTSVFPTKLLEVNYNLHF